MRVSRIALGLALASAIVQHSHGQVAFNCSAFAPTGTCGVAINGQGGQAFQLTNAPSGVLVGSTVNLIPGAGGGGHNGSGMIYQTPVNAQAFTSTFTFVPNGKNIAFVVQNNTSAAGGGSPNRPQAFAAGAGCEAGFFQAFTSGTDPEVNNIFALELDQFSPLLNTAPYPYTFTYSSAQIYQASISPCIPPYAGTHGTDPAPSKLSTSPVPLNNPAGTGLTTTGHTYSVTIAYDGSNVTLNMFDVNAGGFCPGASCYTHTWNGVNIPALVGANTAYVGLTGGTNSDAPADLIIKSFNYSTGPPPSSVVITANSPQYNWNVLPGSQRHINVNITNGTTNKVNWSVLSTTGGASATLSATSNTYPWVDVTAGATGGTCAINGTNPYTVTSTATVTVQAQSVDDTSKKATFLFNVCTPAVQTSIVPFYRTLYSGQTALLQSYIQGSTNTGVTWSITAQPGGGDGVLADTTNRDTVFHATVAGRYTVTATSAADGSKTATATMYVTGNAMPYPVTRNNTEPIDCTVDPTLSGTTYEVGPSQATYHTLADVPQQAIPAGSTIRVHNEDLTGTNPTTYHEYVQLPTQATATQPVRMCGVPDSAGNLPVLDESNATGRSDTSVYAAGYGGITVYRPDFGLYPNQNGARNIIIEGLAIKDTGVGNNYYPPGSGSPTAWITGAACIRLSGVLNTVVAGNDLSRCGNGTFSDFNANSMWGAFTGYNLWEGNWLHANGNSGSATEHQLYLQGWFQVTQFNRVDGYLSGAQGSNFKSRGIGDIVRYNYFGDGPLRQIDMVENQDSNTYQTFESYLIAKPIYPTDAYTADLLAGIQEVWHQTFLYGNIVQNTSAGWLVHFKGDHGQSGMENRTGTLWTYDNTFYTNQGVFDNDDNGGGEPVEFPQTASWNNIIWIPSIGFGTCWNRSNVLIGDFKTNLLSSVLNNIATPINGAACNTETTPWVNSVGNFPSFPLAVPLNTHLTGITAGNFLTDTVMPFNPTTYVPLAGHTQSGMALTGAAAKMPVRFQFAPNVSYPIARSTPVTSTAGGIVGAVDSGVAPPGLWNSLAGWATCILPGCDPGGTGIPVSTNQTILNASPSLSGSSMQMTMVANQPASNALWYWFAADCDLCTNFASDFEVYPVSSSNLSALELDTAFLFSQGLNREYMWGFQYCLDGAGCPGGHNSWDIWDQNLIEWIDSGVTQAPLFGQWNHVTTTNHRSGNNQVYDTFTLNGTLHNLNLTTSSGVLPMGWDSGTGFQFQLSSNTPSGSQTYQMYLDQATFTASTVGTVATPTFSPAGGSYTSVQTVTISDATAGATIYYTTDGSTPTTGSTVYSAPLTVSTTRTIKAIAASAGMTNSAVGSAAYTITITPTLASIAITPANSTIATSAALQYVATCTYSDASQTNCTGTVTWASSAPGKATITGGGLATGIAGGSTTISATSGIVLGTTSLTVTALTVTSIAVTPASSSVTVGSTKQYTATCTWSNATTTNCTSTVVWTSSAPSFATISVSGLAAGVAVGSTTITATSGVAGSTGLTVTAAAKGTKVHGSKGRGRV